MIIPNLGFGGAQRVFYDLAFCLSENYDVIECVFNLDDGHSYPSTNRIVSLDVPAGNNVIQKAWYFFQRILRLRRLKRKLKIDYAISHLEGADYINILTFTKENVILCVHGSKKYDIAISGAIGWIRKRILLPILYRRAAKIVTVARGIKDELINFFGIPDNKIIVINNGFSIGDIEAKASEQIPDKYRFIFDKHVLITHGRLAQEKDHQFLIKMVSNSLLKEKVRLVFIGNGPLLQKLITFSIASGLKTFYEDENQLVEENCNVFFLGYQSNPFVFLKRATIFVFPSRYEGFPMALVEAMACGLPVVSRNCPYGPGEILNPGGHSADHKILAEYGILISNNLTEEKSIDIWVEAIADLLRDPNLISNYQLKSVARSSLFDIKYFCNAWTNLLMKKNTGH